MRTEEEIRDRLQKINEKLSADRISQSYELDLLRDKAMLQWVLD